MAHPGNLTTLALAALGTLVHDLCSRLLLPIIVKSPNISAKRRRLSYNKDKLISQINVACKFLQDLFAQVPADLANQLTNKLLDDVDNWDFEIGNCKHMLEEEMLEKLISSLIHPAVTRIEPPQDLLDCSYIFPETVFCSAMCVKVIIKSAQSLKRLRGLHVIHSRIKCDLSDINLPNHLVEFSGLCNDQGLANIVRSCQNLKYLNVFGSKNVTNLSVDVLLKIKNLEKLNVSETKITPKGVKRLVEGLYKHHEDLKYLAFSVNTVHSLEVLKMFPNLEMSLQLRSMPNMDFQMPELFTFQNICGLQIHCTLNYLNMLLEEIGRKLVYLDAEIEHFGPQNSSPDEVSNLEVSQVLRVGQFCSSLKCLHIEIIYYNFTRLKDSYHKLLAGFQTVCCLTLEIRNKLKEVDFLHFLISQCVNVRKVMLSFDKHVFDMYAVVKDLIALGFMKQIEVIYFQPFCPKCSVKCISDTDVYRQDSVCETVKMLIAHCPNLRVLGGVCEFGLLYPHNSQRLKFVPSWCRCK